MIHWCLIRPVNTINALQDLISPSISAGRSSEAAVVRQSPASEDHVYKSPLWSSKCSLKEEAPEIWTPVPTPELNQTSVRFGFRIKLRSPLDRQPRGHKSPPEPPGFATFITQRIAVRIYTQRKRGLDLHRGFCCVSIPVPRNPHWKHETPAKAVSRNKRR